MSSLPHHRLPAVPAAAGVPLLPVPVEAATAADPLTFVLGEPGENTDNNITYDTMC